MRLRYKLINIPLEFRTTWIYELEQDPAVMERNAWHNYYEMKMNLSLYEWWQWRGLVRYLNNLKKWNMKLIKF